MRWVQRSIDNDQFNELRAEKLHPVFATLLSNRHFGVVRTKRGIQGLLESGLNQLEDPTNITGMVDVAKELSDIQGKKIVIFGDYDVDGVVSSYMLRRILYKCGANQVNVFLPTRSVDGYGLNRKSVSRFIGLLKENYDFIITLDCGTSSFFEIRTLQQTFPKTRILIVDHHLPNERMLSSNAHALCNFHLGSGDPYCTTGLVYQLARLMTQDMVDSAQFLLPYAAIGTIADVCEMLNSNRVLVKNGLKSLDKCTDVGLRALFFEARVKLDDCDEEDIAFKIAPMINASGRMRLASYVYKLLITEDKKEAQAIAKQLMSLNEKRKRIQEKMFQEAKTLVDSQMEDKDSIVAFHEDWNPGIVGIVASKLMEEYGVPVICLGKSDELIKGSARSLEGISVKDVMDTCPELFYKYGGHSKAAGVTMNPEKMEEAWEIFDQAVKKYREEHEVEEPATYYDVKLTQKMVDRMNEDMCERVSRLGPFGQGNPKPCFMIPNIPCIDVRPWKSGKGGFIAFEHLNMTVFGFGPDIGELLGKRHDILVSTTKSFLDEERWALRLVDYRNAQ